MGEAILVLGGARSGKSRLAARLAGARPPVSYLATATVDPTDPEMTARIARHRADRPTSWSTIEAPYDLESALGPLASEDGSVVVDCVTLWLTNRMLGLGGGPAEDDDSVLAALGRSAGASKGRARVVWVSNEVGSGVVPAVPLARRFADLQGLANQLLAEASDEVHLSVAGLALRLK